MYLLGNHGEDYKIIDETNLPGLFWIKENITEPKNYYKRMNGIENPDSEIMRLYSNQVERLVNQLIRRGYEKILETQEKNIELDDEIEI